VRLGAQQVLRRLPINLRPWLGIKKSCNPVTLGLCLQAFTYLSSFFPEKKDFYANESRFLLDELERLQSKGYHGACWGYDFDWETRYGAIPAFVPTSVATGIISNALFQHYTVTGNTRALKLCKAAASFVLNDLRKSYQGHSFCYSYSPVDQHLVLNATMKAARILVQVYSITAESRLLDEARKTVEFVMRCQESSGAWPYAVGDSRTWVDNFHTGYILDCLEEYMRLSGDTEFQPSLEKGLKFYLKFFFDAGEVPKYYRFGYTTQAEKVALWMIQNMQDKEGFFYYQKHRYYTNKIPFMRWSNAWMFVGLSYLVLKRR